MKHIVCFSKGVSSALVAVSVVQRYGSDNVVLLNHDLNPRYEHPDIKRFAFEISNFLNIPITYANFQDVSSPDEIPSQFQVSMAAKAFKIGRYAVCTNHLKTLNFQNWMRKNSPPSFNTFVYYGFAKNELERATRRTKIIHAMGYTAVYPLIDWITTLTLQNIGISPPQIYNQFKHANCTGCIKAGKQHWYVVYCTRPDIWAEAKIAESYIGYTIHFGESLESLESLFNAMQLAGIEPNENIPHQRFWADVNKYVRPQIAPGYVQPTIFMCEC